VRAVKVGISLLLAAVFLIPIFIPNVEASSDTQFQAINPRPRLNNFTPIPIMPDRLLYPGPDVRVTINDFDQNEVSVAVNPTNHSNLLIGANDARGPNGTGNAWWCGAYYSFDEGKTWTERLVPQTGALALSQYSADPSVMFDLQGNAYYTCLGYTPLAVPPYIQNNVIAVAKSLDGGMTFQPPVPVVVAQSSPPFHDKPYMAIDKSLSSPYRGNIYVSWTNFTNFAGGTSPIYFSRSVDGGLSFSNPIKISGAQLYDQGSQPGVGPNGEVYVSFVSYVASQIKLYVTRSLDGGVTFDEPIFITNIVDPGSSLPPGDYRTPTIPSIGVDVSNGPYSGTVYVVFQDGQTGNSDIYIVYSRDRGQIWFGPIKVNNDATSNQQFFPFISVSPFGRVDVVFYDRRNDPMDFLLDIYAGISFDGGGNFKNRRITDNPINPGTSDFIGDYIGVASIHNAFFPGWCGFVGSNEEIFMEKTPIYPTVTRI